MPAPAPSRMGDVQAAGATVSGHVTFRYGGRLFAASLDGVREVTRAVGVEPLPGSVAPVTSVVVLRGRTVPVVDLRGPTVGDATAPGTVPGTSTRNLPGTDRVDAFRRERRGDLLVLLHPDRGVIGLAVDEVVAVHPGTELSLDPAELPDGLPIWVDAVVRAPGCAPLLRVNLAVLAGIRAPARPPAYGRTAPAAVVVETPTADRPRSPTRSPAPRRPALFRPIQP